MDKRDRAVMAMALGTGFGWLFLLDTGLAHTPGDAGVVLTVAVIALAITLAWHILGWLEEWGEQER